MNSMTVILFLGLALVVLAAFQAVIFFLILRSERKFTKDLLTRLASRTIGEYAQVTKILETESKEEKVQEESGPIPIFS